MWCNIFALARRAPSKIVLTSRRRGYAVILVSFVVHRLRLQKCDWNTHECLAETCVKHLSLEATRNKLSSSLPLLWVLKIWRWRKRGRSFLQIKFVRHRIRVAKMVCGSSLSILKARPWAGVAEVFALARTSSALTESIFSVYKWCVSEYMMNAHEDTQELRVQLNVERQEGQK